jgi:hypothetical protein
MVVVVMQKLQKDINMNFGIISYREKCSCNTRGIILKAVFLELCPFLTSSH